MTEELRTLLEQELMPMTHPIFALSLALGLAGATASASDDFELAYLDLSYSPVILIPPPPPPPPPPPAAPPCGPMFDDLPLHFPWFVGDVFTSFGVQFHVDVFRTSSGTPITSGQVYADNLLMACGDRQDLMTNNANVHVLFPCGPARDVGWNFGEYGGNINLMINGDYRNVDDYQALNGLIVGGVRVHVVHGGFGNDCGRVELHGVVDKMMVGGQEHWVDCLNFRAVAAAANRKGDANRDGRADLQDVLAVVAAWGSADSDSDLDASGKVDMRDLLDALYNMSSEDRSD